MKSIVEATATAARISPDGATAPSSGELLAPEVERHSRRRRLATAGLALLRPIRLAAAWWADDPMSARFEQERRRDAQLTRRHGR